LPDRRPSETFNLECGGLQGGERHREVGEYNKLPQRPKVPRSGGQLRFVWRYSTQWGRRLSPLVSCCCEVGISDFAPELRDNRVFAEFKQVFAGYPSEDADDEQLYEYFDRLRTLAIAARSIATEKRNYRKQTSPKSAFGAKRK
jgi:hypothetical protein